MTVGMGGSGALNPQSGGGGDGGRERGMMVGSLLFPI